MARRIAYALLPLVALLCVLEVGLRWRHGELLALDDARESVRGGEVFHQVLLGSHRHDADLGWVPIPDFRGESLHFAERISITTDESGFRVPSPDRPPKEPSILAVGDSFTFGVEAGDGETWPAACERLLGIRVDNAGVPGYGLDQMVMRAERLLLVEGRRPSLLVVAFVANDIVRCGYGRMGIAKPWFEPEATGGLILKGTPVPPIAARTSANRFWSALARSRLADSVMRRVAPAWWLVGRWDKVHDRHQEVARRLMTRLGHLHATTGVRILVRALPCRVEDSGDQELIPELLRLAEENGLHTENRADSSEEIAAHGLSEADFYKVRHYSAAGNAIMGESAAIRRLVAEKTGTP